MSASCKQQVDTGKERSGYTSHGQAKATNLTYKKFAGVKKIDGVVQKKGKQRRCTRNACSHTTIFGIDCGKFIILGADGRITEPDGNVYNNNFLKHVMINEFVYLIYAGDNGDATSYIERLRGLLKGREKAEGDKVPKLAARLLKKMSNEKHKLKPEGERPELLLHVMLACLSSDGLSMYTIDNIENFSTQRRVNATFGGCGGDHAKDYASLKNVVDKHEVITGTWIHDYAHMKEDEAVTLVMEAIADATLRDWRSGGKIYLLIISKRGKKLILKKLVYGQANQDHCTSPYFLIKGERFLPKCLPAKYFPKDWDLLEDL